MKRGRPALDALPLTARDCSRVRQRRWVLEALGELRTAAAQSLAALAR